MNTKQTTNGMYALLVVVAAFLSTGIYFACSADDDWEGNPEYLTTHAPMMTLAGVEGGDDDGFPTRSQILANTTVKNHFESLWENTISNASPTSRREYGCLVFYDKYEGYTFVDLYGEIVTDSTQHASIDFGTITLEQSKKLCALFHTHTPNFSTNPRPVGPSQTDRNVIFTNYVAAFVYDYIDSSANDSLKYIDGGAPCNNPAQIYPYGQEIRKEIPMSLFH